ncbi:MAG: alpha/beta hydrolase [Eubacteriales bacterium]|nr:alpha/beta hydrolase [Eubacteriales bacterium]
MSFASKLIYQGMKFSGIKKLYTLPEDEFLKKVEKMNQSRGYFKPTDKKAVYGEVEALSKYPVLTIQMSEKRAGKAVLYLYGGGTVLGPDKGDVDVARQLAERSGCDVWFPFYPLCTDVCITETFEMVYDCYKQLIEIYGAGNVSTCGFSSGGMLALGVASYINSNAEKLPMPKHVIAVSPAEIPHDDAECERMKNLNEKDVMFDYAFMEKIDKYMRHGNTNVPDYMMHGTLGDFTGVGDIHFFYSEDEVLFGALGNYEAACKRAGVPYTVTSRPGMVHAYTMLPYFKEAKEDFAKIVEILKK